MIGGVLIWSITTVCCGFSLDYWRLLLAPLGVGAGEAALSPAAWSVLADYFHPDKLARPHQRVPDGSLSWRGDCDDRWIRGTRLDSAN
jgi:MFS family permease